MNEIAPLANEFAGLYSDIGRYYTEKVNTHGATPWGVDWPCLPTQELRFVQLLRLCDFGLPLTLNDLGCGYGAMLAFLAKRHKRKSIDYLGIDLSAAMIAEARQLWQQRPNTEFVVGHASHRVADYSLASGIFNVKLGQADALWTRFVEKTLTSMHATSRHGFAVNFLAPLAEGEIGRTQLYRSPSRVWRTFCEKELGATAEVLESYGMLEYTLLVRRG